MNLIGWLWRKPEPEAPVEALQAQPISINVEAGSREKLVRRLSRLRRLHLMLAKPRWSEPESEYIRTEMRQLRAYLELVGLVAADTVDGLTEQIEAAKRSNA